MHTVVCPLCNTGFRDTDPQCPGCGSRFCFSDWPVSEAYQPGNLIPHLIVKWADNTWTPQSSQFIIGRAPDGDGFTLDDPTVSRNHAKMYLDDNVWQISKVSPAGQLKINDVDLPGESCEIFSGDKIKIGISAPLEILIKYTQKRSVRLFTGILMDCEPVILDQQEPLSIGSDVDRCRIVIKNIDRLAAVIYYQKALGSWWIVDSFSSCGVKINGEPVRNEKLFEGDTISIGGVNFLFDSNRLVPLSGQNTGLTVNLSQLSAVVNGGKTLLHDIDLSIKSGEFVGVLGPSGCGKSSLIQRLAGLGGFSKGSVTVNGHSYQDYENQIKSLTSYVPQDVALHSDLTLDEEIKSFCKLHIKSSEINSGKIDTVLHLVQLDNERDKRIGDLSGGQKRRVTIMLELLREPQLLLLDEPTAGLDPATETDIMLYLRRIANQGKTVICSTHILGNLHLFDKLLVLSCGEMVFWGTPGELLNFFQVDSLLELYRMLGNGSKNEQKSTAQNYAADYRRSTLQKKYSSAENQVKDLPAEKHRSPIFQQISGYLYRQALEFTSFRNLSGKDFIKEFFTSAALIQLIIQPVLIALVLKLSCAAYFFADVNFKKIFFFSAIAVFWLGLNSAIRELVRERTPWRCLERLEHISLASYLGSKVIWTVIISAIQVSVFATFLYGLPEFWTEEIAVYWELNKEIKTVSGFTFSWVIVFILLAVCVTGSWIGLAVSAFFKKENPAVGLLPVILIPVLFFSQPMMNDSNFGDYPLPPVEHVHDPYEYAQKCRECVRRRADEIKTDNGQYNIIAMYIKRCMPCHEPQVFMDQIHNKLTMETQKDGDISAAEEKRQKNAEEQLNATVFRLLRNTLGYMLFSLLLMVIFQYNNEKKWEGR